MNCPGCECNEPTSEHLIKEYHELVKAGFNSMFGYNARRACNAVVDELHKRGITSEETIFGHREFKKWSY